MTKGTLDHFRSALRQLDGQVIAIDPRHASHLAPIVADLAQGREVSDARLSTLSRPDFQSASRSGVHAIPLIGAGGKSLAILPMHGIALYDLEFFPYCFSTRRLAQTLAELSSDKAIGTILLDMNTPGGHVTGTQEAADAVFSARSKKPVVGLINPLCASAGYWIGSQCSKLIAVPSADTGSIGVFMQHVDISGMLEKAGVRPTFIFAGENKVEGNSYQPLSAKAKNFYQGEVDQTYSDFLAAVARGRGALPSIVRAQWGGGRTLGAKDAFRLGMVDQIAAPDQALRSLSSHQMAGLAPDRIQAQIRRQRLALEAQI